MHFCGFCRCGKVACFAIALSLATAAVAQAATVQLVGSWDMNQTFGRQVSGPVELVSSGPSPTARIGTREVRGLPEGSGLRFDFDRTGTLRTTSLNGSPQLGGMWIQPPTISQNVYATPVRFARVASGHWTGTIAPLPNRAFMRMIVERAPDGMLRAYLRDSLFNLGFRFGMMRVDMSGNHITFVSVKAGTLRADLDPAGNRFALHFDGMGLPPLQFARVMSQSLPAATAYRRPVTTGDGWATATAESAGISTAALEHIVHSIVTTPLISSASPAVQSLSIARHGKLVFDRYFAGFNESMPHDTRSAGKTYADVLTGAAIAAGAPLSAATPLLSILPQYSSIGHPDPRKAAITLGNALSMSTGLDCDDENESSAGNEDREQSQSAQPDWYKLVLDAPMVSDPGTKAVYCSASINLAGAAIASVTRSWLPLYFEQHVAQPLDMQMYALNLTPTHTWYLGGGAQIRPRDFLKIGQVFLDHGRWRGRQLVDRAWIAQSWQPRLALGPHDAYGYAWHIRTYRGRGRSYRTYEAQGNGGQILDVIPALDLAAMITQGNYNNFATWGTTRDSIMTELLASVTP